MNVTKAKPATKREPSVHQERLSRLFNSWRETEAKVTLYGPTMPQAKQVVEAFYHSLKQIFVSFPSFSIVKKGPFVEIVATDAVTQQDISQRIHDAAHAVQAFQALDKFEVQSVTFYRGLKPEEFDAFFCGLHMSPGDARQYKGFAQYLQRQHITHIKLNQRYLALKGTQNRQATHADIARTAEAAINDVLKQAQDAEIKGTSVKKRVFSSIWNRYLTDQLEPVKFKTQHRELIEIARERPEELVKVLEHMAAKQKEIEAFLANLEHKLFDVGFPERAVAKIREGLVKPRKVTIGEDELARLRQIEQDYLSATHRSLGGSLDDRLQRSLDKINIMQRKLSDERERGEAIIRQMSQGVMVLDKHGKILEMNPIARKVLGISPEAAKGKQLKDVIEDHHMLSVVSDWDKETDDFIPKHIEIQAGNEETIDTIRESAIVIEDENGRPIGGVSALQDVIRQKELENRKNDILDVLGHDLRTPLTVVKQSISLMADSLSLPERIPEDQQERIISTCKRNVERLERLVNKILDMRQLETGKIILKKDQTQTNKLIEDAVYSLDSWAQDKHIAIELELAPLPDILCDAERIYQVVTNLMSNALKFTPENGRIRVQGQTIDSGGETRVEICVTDFGVGIQQDDLQRIFNKYEQVSLKSPEGVSGLGLGLSTCKTIIEMHQGRIWANSNPGQGSTFVFQVPVTAATEESPR